MYTMYVIVNITLINIINVWYTNAKYTPKKVSCNYLSIIVNKKLNYLKACRLPSSDNLIEL